MSIEGKRNLYHERFITAGLEGKNFLINMRRILNHGENIVQTMKLSDGMKQIIISIKIHISARHTIIKSGHLLRTMQG